jgi:hypothetical protein
MVQYGQLSSWSRTYGIGLFIKNLKQKGLLECGHAVCSKKGLETGGKKIYK